MGSIWNRATPDGQVHKTGKGKRGKKDQKAESDRCESNLNKHFPEEKIDEIAAGMLTGKYFTSDFINPTHYAQMIPMVFLPLAFAAKDTNEFIKKHDITMVYAEMRTALPRAVNGYPCCSEATLVPRDIHKKILEKYHEKGKALFPNGRPKR